MNIIENAPLMRSTKIDLGSRSLLENADYDNPTDKEIHFTELS